MPNPLGAAAGFQHPAHSSQPCSLGPTDRMERGGHTGPRGDADLGGSEGEWEGGFFRSNLDVQSVVTTTPGREQPSLSHLQLTGRSWRLINEPQLIGAVKSSGEGALRLPSEGEQGNRKPQRSGYRGTAS